MKQQMSPAITAVIIVLVVAVAGFFGYKYINGGNGRSPAPPPEAQKWMNPGSNQRAPQTARPTGPGGASNPSRFPGYPGGK